MLFNQLRHLYTILPWIALALAAFISLFFINAPYGRYSGKKSGVTINGSVGWLIMEAPSAFIFGAFFVFNFNAINLTALVFLLMWESHYIHRALIYPFTLRRSPNRFPVIIMVSGLAFNVVNAYLNGNSVLSNSGQYTMSWLGDIRFITGFVLFFVGFYINRQSDYLLYKIRINGQTDYGIPYGGLFRWVSCPNYLGEIIIWTGWALATWSLAGLAFAVWTIANLAPRAVAHHKWYREKFENYPRNRRALVPGIW